MWLRHHSPPPPFSSLIFSVFLLISSSDSCLDSLSERKVQSTPEKMESVSCEETKACVDCKTSKTPLWRSGPAGPKSLCNACGIRYRKKRSTTGSPDKKREKQAPPSSLSLPPLSPSSSSCSTSAAACCRKREMDEDVGNGMGRNLRIKLMAVGKEVVVLQRRRSRMKVRDKIGNHEYKKLGEVERAAFLLMSLSCGGSVFG